MDSSGVIRTVLGTAQILVVEVEMRYATGFHGGKIVVFFVLENGTWYHQEQQHVDFFLKVDRYGGSQDLRPGELNEFPSDSKPVE